MQTQNYKGIVIDENWFKDDGAPLTMAMLVQGNLKEVRFGRSPAIEAVFPKFKPYHYSRIYNDEVTRPDARFCKTRVDYYSEIGKYKQKFSICLWCWTRLLRSLPISLNVKGWRITQVTTI